VERAQYLGITLSFFNHRSKGTLNSGVVGREVGKNKSPGTFTSSGCLEGGGLREKKSRGKGERTELVGSSLPMGRGEVFHTRVLFSIRKC